jgi:proliferating cell nuclear antigen
MPHIFYCKTSDAFVFKVLSELLQNNIRKACFELSSDGMKLCMSDTYHHILVNMFLEAHNFSVYKFNRPGKRYIGINLVHLHKCVKTLKKKDSLTLMIDEDEENELVIQVFPKENSNRVTRCKVKIQSMQYIDTELPTGYGKPVIVPSSEYQKMVKEMNSIGSSITVFAREFLIKFISDPTGTYSKDVTIGDEDECGDNDEEYCQEFESEKLNRIAKIAGLSVNMQIFPKEGLPLLFTSSVGTLGKISIYVKSKEQIEMDNNTIESDSESDEDDKSPVVEQPPPPVPKAKSRAMK